MKKFLTFLFLIVSMITNAQTWQWAKSAGGTTYDASTSMAIDGNGNIYVTGYFDDPSITFGTLTLYGSSSSNLFIVKYDANGTVLWARTTTGIYSDAGLSITTDGSGNVYVTGYFWINTTFGSTTLTGTGPHDVFITKYDTNGNVLWAKSAGGWDRAAGLSVASDAIGNVYVTGYFESASIVFGPTLLTNTGFDGIPEIFIVKYDTNGNVLWAKSAGGGGALDYEKGHSIGADGSGNVYITGYFDGPVVTFDSITLPNAISNSISDFFIVKYDINGNVLWAQRAGGTNMDEGMSITVDSSSGNVYATGYFQSSSITFGAYTLINSGGWDLFIVKYDGNGNVLWAKSEGAASQVNGNSITTDGTGNVYVTGYFWSSTITFGSTTLINSGINDIFIAKYDSSGNHIWATSAGGIKRDEGYDIVTDTNSNVYITGSFFSPNISFGSTLLTKAAPTNSVQSDIFIAKLSQVTGLEESSFSDGINVFPNPSNETFTISGLSMNATVSVYNLVGEIISSSIASSSTETFTLNASDGVYFIHVKSGAKQAVKKIVVNRW
jgi:hypothetical protein